MPFGQEPNIFHLKFFDCVIYVPIAPPQRTKMGLQIRLEIYVGYESLFIIRFLESQISDVFTACFVDCHFNEAIFSALGGKKKQLKKKII